LNSIVSGYQIIAFDRPFLITYCTGNLSGTVHVPATSNIYFICKPIMQCQSTHAFNIFLIIY